MKSHLLPIAFLLFAAACGETTPKPSADAGSAAVLYFGGDIVTMEGSPGSTVEAVVTEGSKIVFAGDLKTAKEKYASASELNLQGQTMMPGLIEQHLHPFLGALTLSMPVIAPEDWELPTQTWPAAKDNADYLAKLKAAFAQHPDANQTFFTWGYHQYFHGELNRKMLDAISTTTPIGVWHRSAHEFIVNSAFLKKFGIDAADLKKTSEIAQKQSNLDKGHFLENGAMVYLLPKIYTDLASPERFRVGLKQMVSLLHQNGVTAYNEPGALMDPATAALYMEVLGAEEVPMYSYFIVEGNTMFMAKKDSSLIYYEKTRDMLPKEGKIRFFEKQIKFLLDGAIISQLMQMKAGYLDGHHGEWMLEPALMDSGTKLFWDNGFQLHIHVNGDEGLEQLLNIIEKRMKEYPRQDHRTVMVHFANSTDEQIEKLTKLNCIVSANPYYVTGFADKYAQIGLGEERAHAMVRLAPLEKNGVSISLHSDLPMGPANPLYLAWCAITRTTNNGNVVRPDLALSRHAALKAITIDAAYSWREEERIGSIKAGKTANFTILKENPYKVDVQKLKDIAVASTVFEGRMFPVEKK